MEIYSCGLNAHKQLDSKTSYNNLATFQRTAEGDRVSVLCATLCATIIDVDGQVEHRGYHTSGQSVRYISHKDEVQSFIGDISGIHGALTKDGTFCELERHRTSSDSFLLRLTEHRWRGREALSLEHVAIAGNGQIAVITTRTCSRISWCSSLCVIVLNIWYRLVQLPTSVHNRVPIRQFSLLDDYIVYLERFSSFLCILYIPVKRGEWSTKHQVISLATQDQIRCNQKGANIRGANATT